MLGPPPSCSHHRRALGGVQHAHRVARGGETVDDLAQVGPAAGLEDDL